MRRISIAFWIALLSLATAPVEAGCPQGMAAKLISEEDESFEGWSSFEWYTFVGVQTFGTRDQIEFEFSVVPFSSGIMTVGADDAVGATSYQVLFAEGAVSNNANYGNPLPILRYVPGVWSLVRVVFDFESQSSAISINGVSSPALPFIRENVYSLQSFRVNCGSAQETPDAWIDSIRLTHRTESETVALFEADFESGVPTIYTGTMEQHPSGEGGALPPQCDGPTPITPLAWSQAKVMFR